VHGFTDWGVRVDPTRIAAQIVTGIGPLGAGAIIRQGLSVRGLTIERQGGRLVSLDVAPEGDRRPVAVDLELHTGSAPAAVVAGVAEIDGVLGVRWME
jgi:hypothetical protein